MNRLRKGGSAPCRFAFTVLPLAFALSSALAQSSGCNVPENMTKDQKLPCPTVSAVTVNQPTLTAAEIHKGSDFDAADPGSNHFSWFTADNTIFCYLPPAPAFSKVPGDSNEISVPADDIARRFSIARKAMPLRYPA